MTDPSELRDDATADALKERLAAAEARIEAAAERRAQRSVLSLEAQTAAAEREAADEEKFAELEDEHGPEDEAIGRVQTRSGMIVIKRPRKLLFDNWSNSKQKPEDNHRLFKHALLYPTMGEVMQWFEDEPFALVRCLNKAAELAGVRMEEVNAK